MTFGKDVNEKDFLSEISRHQGIIRKICRVYRRTSEDQQDCFQETLLQLWKSFPSFRGDSKISTWIYRIALNVALTGFRKREPEITYSDMLPDSPEFVQAEETTRRQEWLIWAIRQLTEADRALLILYLDELSYREIADITGLSEGNIGVKLNRIKRRLTELAKKNK
ncbi:sigma-70 family RNA polymerase sigma factor [Pedobacter sp. JY14-1]|uniref:RNA polymerase sigma factor n=1 Tax=Pedobacter sp. JY14-1 TaxID=3034151 RepID=UPI0023E109D4|nr:sigma-70 family RNA polymerase sigma factor [Pedobacter sp. JY14-1]